MLLCCRVNTDRICCKAETRDDYHLDHTDCVSYNEVYLLETASVRSVPYEYSDQILSSVIARIGGSVLTNDWIPIHNVIPSVRKLIRHLVFIWNVLTERPLSLSHKWTYQANQAQHTLRFHVMVITCPTVNIYFRRRQQFYQTQQCYMFRSIKPSSGTNKHKLKYK